MTSRTRWRLTAKYLAAIVAAVFVLGLLLSYSIEHLFIADLRKALNADGQLLRTEIERGFHDGMEPGDLDDMCRLLSRKINARVTVYGRDGGVLGDSERGGAGSSDAVTVRIPPVKNSTAGQVGLIKLSASPYEAQRAAGKAVRVALVALVLAGLVGAVAAARLASSIAEPIRRMNETARELAAGDLTRRLHTDAADDAGQLAESFNLMADRLQSNLDQLAQEKHEMGTVLTTMADGIIVTDKSGTIVLFNRAAERLFGLSSERIIGEQIEAAAAVPEIPEMVRRMLGSNKPIRRELATTLPAERILNVFAAPIHDQKRRIAGGVVVLQDVTEVRSQAAIRQDFVANVSHELRTPVAAIRAIVGALQSGAKEDPAMAKRFLDSLEAETDRLSLLLNDLLNLSELESGRQQPKRTVVRVREIAEQAVSDLSGAALRRGVRVAVDIDPEVCVFANRRQMLQVLQNLVDNAVKYTAESGSADVTASESETEVAVTVRDTGVGIPPSDLDRIFERFYRVDKARSRQLGGTGLGLSIVKDIVDAHEGRITIESKVGEGSVFTIRLPKPGSEDDSDVG